jgi:sphingolipid delta-4 desaturase
MVALDPWKGDRVPSRRAGLYAPPPERRERISPSAWHRARQGAILAAHPDVASLAGPNPWTAAFVVLTVALQLGVAFALRSAPWWSVVVAACLVGALAVHALGVLIHECTHNLVFRGTAANKALALLANVPLVVPGAIGFRDKHLAHHRHLGEAREVDFQRPAEEVVAWVGASAARKVLWLVFGSFLSARALPAGPERNLAKRPTSTEDRTDPWILANFAVELVVIAAIGATIGPRAIAYLLLSGLFTFGAHPVSLRGYAEHFDQRAEQPTNSYYGPFNVLSFNVGYHVEHHDLPAVPWNRLPEVRRRAAPFYEALATTRSWLALWARFIIEPQVGVGRYVAPTIPSPS